MSKNSKLDELFLIYTLEIEKLYKQCNKHEQIRVEQWVIAYRNIVPKIMSSNFK